MIIIFLIFRVEDDNEYTFPVCPDTVLEKKTQISPVYGNYNSSSQFYVFVGVIAMLYAILALAFYVVADSLYRSNQLFPKLVQNIFPSIIRILMFSASYGYSALRQVSILSSLFSWTSAGLDNLCSADAPLARVVRNLGRVGERHELLQRAEPRVRTP